MSDIEQLNSYIIYKYIYIFIILNIKLKYYDRHTYRLRNMYVHTNTQ